MGWFYVGLGVWVTKAPWLEELEFILKAEKILTRLLRREGIPRRRNWMIKSWEVRKGIVH